MGGAIRDRSGIRARVGGVSHVEVEVIAVADGNGKVLCRDPDSPYMDGLDIPVYFKTEDDQLSLHISDILLFTEIDDSQMNLIPDAGEENFVLGTVSYNTEEIAILNPKAFELLVRKDCGNV